MSWCEPVSDNLTKFVVFYLSPLALQMIFLKVYAQGKFLPQEKWGFKAITTKSEENRLGLKFDFTSS